jgi:vitamin B12 transporter
VTVAQGSGPGALTSVFIRGGESDYVQVLVDGVQMNEPGGAFNWAHLRTDDIERIEVVRGPASVLYGSDAVSGVVQIFTRSGGSSRVEIGVNGGRGDKSAQDADAAFRNDAFDASVTGSTATPLLGASTLRYGGTYARHASNGLFAYNSDYDNTNLSESGSK